MARYSQTRRSPQRKRRQPARSSGGGIWFWLLALLVVGGGIAAYEHRDQLPRQIAAYLRAAEKNEPSRPTSRQAQQTKRTAPTPPNEVPQRAKEVAARPSSRVPKPLTRPDSITTAAVKPGAPIPPAAVGKGAKDKVQMASLPADKALTGRGHQGRFYFCGTSGLDSCVAAGDTFWYQKTRISLADIDAPSTEGAKCQQERDLGFAAQVRLRELLNAGSFELASVGGEVGEGQAERLVSRNGRSLGAILVAEGLARPRAAGRGSWCP
jgi:Micrococcal nuclease (thermonuclease) homologs